MADGHENSSSAQTTQNLADSLLNFVDNDQPSGICELNGIEGTTSEENEMIKFIKDTERAIASTSMAEVKGKLSKQATSKLNGRRDTLIEYCKYKSVDFPKEKPFRRITRTGGKTANEKLSSDIVALVKFASCHEVTSDLHDMFKKSSSNSVAAFGTFQESVISSNQCGSNQFSNLLERLDENYYQLREDFDQATTTMKQEISDLKKNICDKEAKISNLKTECAEFNAGLSEMNAKICSLESEIAVFKANHKQEKQIVSDNLLSQNLKLEEKQDSLTKLEEKSNKLSKEIEKLKKQTSTNKKLWDTGDSSITSLTVNEKLPNSWAGAVKEGNTESQSSVTNANLNVISDQINQPFVNTKQNTRQSLNKQSAQLRNQNRLTSDKVIEVESHASDNGANAGHVVDESNCSNQTEFNTNSEYQLPKPLEGTSNQNEQNRCVLSQSDHSNEVNDDLFVGVKKRRTKRLYLGGVREGVTDQLISNHMKERGITPTFVRLMKSKRKGTVAVRVNIESGYFERALEKDFWPNHVYVRQWFSNQKWSEKIGALGNLAKNNNNNDH